MAFMGNMHLLEYLTVFCLADNLSFSTLFPFFPEHQLPILHSQRHTVSSPLPGCSAPFIIHIPLHVSLAPMMPRH